MALQKILFNCGNNGNVTGRGLTGPCNADLAFRGWPDPEKPLPDRPCAANTKPDYCQATARFPAVANTAELNGCFANTKG
jgi:hypothetical protein